MLGCCLPEIVVFSDASNSAAGAFSVSFRNSIFHAFWSELDAQKSSTYRELKAVFLALQSFEKKLQCKKVKWFTDSQNCVRILNCGSFKEELQLLAIQIYHLCVANSISLDIQWIPREENIQADCISKTIDYDDWGVSKDF